MMETKDTNKLLPKDAQVIQAIFKDLGIHEYESRVINQLLEFTYRYVSTILEEAHIFSNYAKKKSIDADDVKLAIQLKVEKSFTNPPPRNLLLEIARNKNSQPLQTIKSNVGTRLPPDRYSLISCNYKLKSANSIKAIQQPQYHIKFNKRF